MISTQCIIKTRAYKASIKFLDSVYLQKSMYFSRHITTTFWTGIFRDIGIKHCRAGTCAKHRELACHVIHSEEQNQQDNLVANQYNESIKPPSLLTVCSYLDSGKPRTRHSKHYQLNKYCELQFTALNILAVTFKRPFSRYFREAIRTFLGIKRGKVTSKF
ncbi:hypothetical protein ElyMa_003008700 [Elysia marginata]|uniref:Uncharacterized protein n=1 Tax=Elysia marginata TaxID=1093978 RepID=A0AAV4IHM0_9GAST|nr:hypothetical protein ElyMa_003008700 [Elysia marginata]